MKKDRLRGRAVARPDVDADSLFGSEFAAGRRGHHKDLQLCRQAHEALSAALALVADDVLEDVFIVDVLPAPDASRLVVVVGAPPSADLDEVLVRLEKRSTQLRAEVAESITRKRAPTLAFRVVPGKEDG
jgi:ribosome-binding factor A